MEYNDDNDANDDIADAIDAMMNGNEDMQNYMEIWNWMTGLGFPYSLQQYADLRDNSVVENPTAMKGDFYERSDGTLNILNSDFNIQSQVIFSGLYPVYLSAFISIVIFVLTPLLS